MCVVYKLDGRLYHCAWLTGWIVVCISLHCLQVGESFVLFCMVYMLDSRFVPVCTVYLLDGRLYQCAWFTCWMVVFTSVHGLHVG